MPFNKTTAKINGQKSSRKGIKNKVNNDFVREILADESNDIKNALKSLKDSPKEYLNMIVKLLPYAIPIVTELNEEPDINQTTLKLNESSSVTFRH